MPSITLACYSLRFRKVGVRPYIQLDDPALGKLRQFLVSYFTKLETTPFSDTGSKKLLSTTNVSAPDHMVRGRIVSGEYGYETDLIDVKGKRAKYRRTTTQAEMIPFYFQIYLPEVGNTALLLLQRFGVFGVRSVLSLDLLPRIEKEFPHVSMRIIPQVPDGVLKKLLGGKLSAITLRRDTLPNDAADALFEQDPEAGRMDIVLTAKNGNFFQGILRKLKEQYDASSAPAMNHVIEFPGFDYDRALIDVEIGGKTQRVDLSNLAKLRARVDVTKAVNYGSDGHPTLDSISTQADSIIAGLRKDMKI